MADNFTWIISRLDCHPQLEGLENVVSAIYWRRQLTRDDKLVDACGVQNIVFDENNSFTPYENITPALATQWLVFFMGADAITDLDSELTVRMANIINPDIVTPTLPWV